MTDTELQAEVVRLAKVNDCLQHNYDRLVEANKAMVAAIKNIMTLAGRTPTQNVNNPRAVEQVLSHIYGAARVAKEKGEII